MSYEKHKWVNNVDAVDEDKMNHIENGIKDLDDNKVNKSGDTLTGGLMFENKDGYDAIRKNRIIDGENYQLSIGLGVNASSRMELVGPNGQTLCYVEVRSDGIYNGKNGKKLAEQESSRVNITANTGTLVTNNSYKIGNVVGLNAKFSGVSVTAGNATVLCTLPSGYYNSSVEMSAIAGANSGTHVSCWIRTNGQVVVMPNSNLNNAEIRLITSFIV